MTGQGRAAAISVHAMWLRNALLWLSARLPKPRVIYDREGGTPYLSRWYLIGNFNTDVEFAGQSSEPTKRRPFELYLHRFHRSDDDSTLHNHPWRWALSLVLVGGYSEERRVGDRVVRRNVWPLRFNFVRGSDYHRVDLFGQDAWTLFLVGPKVSSWYFWDRDLKARMHWRRFIDVKRNGAVHEWEPDSRGGA